MSTRRRVSAGSAAPRTWPNGAAAVRRRKSRVSAVISSPGITLGMPGGIGGERVGGDAAGGRARAGTSSAGAKYASRSDTTAGPGSGSAIGDVPAAPRSGSASSAASTRWHIGHGARRR